jgi:peptidyl-prolyl cis-trans isomerase A (cyclophilin A)
MRHPIVLLLLTLLLTSCGSEEKVEAPRSPRVLLTTTEGEILVEVYPKAAPYTVKNFFRYVDEGRFQGALFYRVVTPDNQPENPVRIEVIQGGLDADPDTLALPPIPHETTKSSGLLHVDGALSMARLFPGTAASEFFICVGDQPELDFEGLRNPDGQGFAVFGQVIEGMDVVRAIQGMPETDQRLEEPVAILTVVRVP